MVLEPGSRQDAALAVHQREEAAIGRHRLLQQILPRGDVDPGTDHIAQHALVHQRHRDRRRVAIAVALPDQPGHHRGRIGTQPQDFRDFAQARAGRGRVAAGRHHRVEQQLSPGVGQENAAPVGTQPRAISQRLLEGARVFARQQRRAPEDGQRIDRRTQLALHALRGGARGPLQVGPHACLARLHVAEDAHAHQDDHRYGGDQHDGRQVSSQRGRRPGGREPSAKSVNVQ